MTHHQLRRKISLYWEAADRCDRVGHHFGAEMWKVSIDELTAELLRRQLMAELLRRHTKRIKKIQKGRAQ